MRRRPEEAQRAFDEQVKSSRTPGSVPGNSLKQLLDLIIIVLGCTSHRC